MDKSELSKYFSELGRKGGAKSSTAKRKAVRDNLAKARAKLAKLRKTAKATG